MQFFRFSYPPNIGQKVIQEAREHETMATGFALARASPFNWSWAASCRGPTPCYDIVAGMFIWLVARGYLRPLGSTTYRNISRKCSCLAFLFSLPSGRKYSSKRRAVVGFLTSEARQCQLLVTHLPIATISGGEMAFANIAGLFAGCEMTRLAFAVFPHLIYDNCRCLVCPPPFGSNAKINYW